MRFKSITLSWFRGAADPVVLDTGLKSIVVYGQNGTGKSCFVDAVEYAVNGGKISHLSHEYSGAKQEKGIRNTHTPTGTSSDFSITFTDNTKLSINIAPNGSHTRSGTATLDIGTWDYRRTVLRQDEIARFIASSKGNKYSDLLPLLGLHDLEVAAENLRQLVKSTEKESKLGEKRGAAGVIAATRKQVFGDATDAEISKQVDSLHKKYCAASATQDPYEQCAEVIAALNARIASLSAENQRHLLLKSIGGHNLSSVVGSVREKSGKLAGSVEPLIAEKLEVLQSAAVYAQKLEEGDNIDCPACGQKISRQDFKTHVQSEGARLKEIITVFESRRAAIGDLISALKDLASALNHGGLATWRTDIPEGVGQADLDWIAQHKPEALRQAISESDLADVEKHWKPVIAAAAKDAAHTPPDIATLSHDKSLADSASTVLSARQRADEITNLEGLLSYLATAEASVRKQIRERSEAVISKISDDIADIWKALHPGEPIEDVRFYLPDGDKAIDIALKFYGKEQDSPRLTLSEGYRNSLGLCIFLALAKRETDDDKPLILDDVVVSFDRNHRGMIAELLQEKFSGRQVILFTHDRDWYTDLRYQLDDKAWSFKTLLPYETPTIGIRWSHKTTSFDEARSHLPGRPDAAVNDARKVMDVELAAASEKMQLRLPYLRGEKNDHRTCGNFLARIAKDGSKCFQKRTGKDKYDVNTEALELLDKASSLLVTWANRGSHTDDVAKSEAVKVIDACEKALAALVCATCGKHVGRLEDKSSELVQCQCGEIRWRYGKG